MPLDERDDVPPRLEAVPGFLRRLSLGAARQAAVAFAWVSNELDSSRAVQMSVYIVRAFVKMR